MLKSESLQEIIKIVNERGNVSTKELAEKLNISEISVRRYTTELEQENVLRRVHGGVQSLQNITSSFELKHSKKLQINREQKLAIVKEAANLIENGDTIYISPGSTTQLLANLLVDKRVTVITNSITTFDALKNSTRNDLLLVGGSYRKTTGCFFGSIANHILSQFHLDKAFFSVNAITGWQALNHNIEEGETQRVALDCSTQKFLLADSSKFEKKDIYSFYDIRDIDGIIVDNDLAQEKIRYYQQYCKVYLA